MKTIPYPYQRHRPGTALTTKPVPVVVMSPFESLRVVTSNGQPLLEITYDAQGPAIRLAQENLRLDCGGDLDLTARNITMRSSEAVTIQGQVIRLN